MCSNGVRIILHRYGVPDDDPLIFFFFFFFFLNQELIYSFRKAIYESKVILISPGTVHIPHMIAPKIPDRILIPPFPCALKCWWLFSPIIRGIKGNRRFISSKDSRIRPLDSFLCTMLWIGGYFWIRLCSDLFQATASSNSGHSLSPVQKISPLVKPRIQRMLRSNFRVTIFGSLTYLCRCCNKLFDSLVIYNILDISNVDLLSHVQILKTFQKRSSHFCDP